MSCHPRPSKKPSREEGGMLGNGPTAGIPATPAETRSTAAPETWQHSCRAGGCHSAPPGPGRRFLPREASPNHREAPTPLVVPKSSAPFGQTPIRRHALRGSPKPGDNTW